jgi:hypothetical protein
MVGGNFLEVMDLSPVLGRMIDMLDDGPNAAGAVVLTYRFWTRALGPSIVAAQRFERGPKNMANGEIERIERKDGVLRPTS